MRTLLFASLATIVLAQTPPTQPEDKGRIEGVLVNQANGQPLKKGTVSLRAAVTGPRPADPSATPNSYSVASDAEGRFVFEQVDPGQYTLMADRPGYIHATYRSSSGAVLNLSPGQTIKNLRFTITPQGVIAGHVVDEDGDPITEVRVQAMRWVSLNGVRRLGFGQGIPVDDQGNFRISNLPAAHYVLSAEFNRPPPLNTGKNQDAYVTTYYPNALEVSEAAQIALTAGAEVTNVEIRLRKVRVFRVRGKIVDPSGALVRNTALALFPKNASPTAGYTGRNLAISRDGNFEFSSVRPGSYFVEPAMNVFFSGGDQNETGTNKKLFGRYAVTVSDADLKDIVVSLNAGATLTGTIATEDGPTQPPPTGGSSTAPAPKPPPLPTVRLAPADSAVVNPYNARSNADGTFEVRDLAPERYRINVDGTADGSYVKSIRFGNEDVTHGILDLTPGMGGAIEIRLSANAADVSGTVHNDKSETVGDVVVTLGPASVETAAQTLFFRQTRTSANGQFKLRNLPPGDYRLLAWEEVDGQLITDPEFRARFDSNSVVVKLSDGSHETSDLKLIGRDAIEV
ncbi:MAG TPA: carboxypeptidase-like regulatory domain-containing protein, partial [Bryobacteraceae bacterium]|nr:carboxypeptidase-like regulatory domain-containing protein [Bryobacteraceae bacterium]